MTEVTFYLSSKAGDGVRQALAWRIADKALRQQRQVYIHCRDENHARELDNHFWHTPKSGFLPHAVCGDAHAPVMLGHGGDPGEHHDVLINLTDQVPDFASRFQRVAEMISGADNERQKGRERFRFYRERGFPVTTHELG
ncbi:DNA polymerase III subunit chi [Alcanivorax hongdengensis A-11-3]|uniref:DNA polymerase III subunit chi n=1 Tax=Alcanivorax hongdengensis A-11-3 TaxID=1177179 RepID=L0WE85_9GAMM|nr:DNA polymerase III subunit chi [Alcanivorax hongdengensis]EKF74120.1 DNA polymerase III subunit chi [Alcanivorax hongdengensis A-11-3]